MLLTKEILAGIYSGASLPPSAPLFLYGIPEEHQVVLTWSEPLNPGISPINDYIVQYSSDGGLTWITFVDGVTTNVSSIVTGLVNGTSYLFRVAAVNAAGQGPFSEVAGPYTPYLISVSITRDSAIGFSSSPEYVEIVNNTPVTVPLSGWYLMSHQNPPACNIGSTPEIFKFPLTATITPTQTVRVYSGTGSNLPPYNNPPTSYWWGSLASVWNDNGDIVHLYNSLSALVSIFATGQCIEYSLQPKDGFLFGYNFAGVSGTTQSSITATTVSQLTASDMIRLAGLNPNTILINAWGSVSYNANSTIQESINNNDCFAFSISSTKAVILSGARGPVLTRTSTGPASAAIVYNFTNLWTNPSDYNVLSNFKILNGTVEDYSVYTDDVLDTIPIVVPQSTPLYMRFVPYGSTNTAGRLSIFDFVTTTGDGIDFAFYGSLSS